MKNALFLLPFFLIISVLAIMLIGQMPTSITGTQFGLNIIVLAIVGGIVAVGVFTAVKFLN